MVEFQIFIDLESEEDVGAKTAGAPLQPSGKTTAKQEDEDDLVELDPAHFSRKQRRHSGSTIILLEDSESCTTTGTGTGNGTWNGYGKAFGAAARTSSLEDDVVMLDEAQVEDRHLRKQRAKTVEHNKRALITVTNTVASIEARMKEALDQAAKVSQSSVAEGSAPLIGAEGTEKLQKKKAGKQTERRGKRKATEGEEERLLDGEGHLTINPEQKGTARTRAASSQAARAASDQAPVEKPVAQSLAPRKGQAAAGAGAAGRGGRVPKPKKKAAAGRRVKAVLPRIPAGPNWINAYGRPEPSEEAILDATKQLFAALGGRLAFLPKGDAEHNTIMASHLAATGVPIVAIHKVVHGPARLAAFEEEARALELVRKGGANVQVCWHGTSEEALLSILKTGFTASRTVNGKSAGNGLYMAPTHAPTTSIGYTGGGDGHVGHMFLLRVILGGVEVGYAGMDLPSDPDLYDSAVDHLEDPSERVVWTPYLYSRILIEYVISFKVDHGGVWF